MKYSLLFLGVSAALFGMPALARADTPVATNAVAPAPPAPVRRLVYAFTYGTQGDLTSHEDSVYMRSGLNDYVGNVNDSGTITVDVVKEQADKGLIVTISEQAKNTRNADPATCVVYGNTTTICDPNKTVYSEEYTLLRFLGTTFVDPNQLDPKQHWRIDESNGALSTVADYTIAASNNGVMTIDEARVIKQLGTAHGTTSDVATKIQYDFARLLPTGVSEYVTMRQDQNIEQTMTTTVQTSLKLVSDSLAKN